MSIRFNATPDAADRTPMTAGISAERQYKEAAHDGLSFFSAWPVGGGPLSGTVTLERKIDAGDVDSWIEVASVDGTTGSQPATIPNGIYRAVSPIANVHILLEGT